MRFSHKTFEDSNLDKNNLEYQLSLQLSKFSTKLLNFLKKKKDITYEDLKSFEKEERIASMQPESNHIFMYLPFKKVAQILRQLKIEGFDNQDDELNERFLFIVLFGSDTPTHEQLEKRLKLIYDLSRMTIEPLKYCLFNKLRLGENVKKYIFREKDSKLYMLVNVNDAKGIDGEDIKIAEHIYIHRLPSAMIGRWAKQLINPSIQKEPPLAKLLHKYAISVIQPQYIVSNPLSVMDPVFTELQKEGFLENIPSDSDEFKKVNENIPYKVYAKTNSTCEDIKVMFKVINIPDISELPEDLEDQEEAIPDYKISVTHELTSKPYQTIGDIRIYLKLRPDQQLAEKNQYVSLSDDMFINSDMNLWVIPEEESKECKVEVHENGLTKHNLGLKCGETIGDIKKFLKLHPTEKLSQKNQYVSLSDDMPITKDMILWIIPKSTSSFDMSSHTSSYKP